MFRVLTASAAVCFFFAFGCTQSTGNSADQSGNEAQSRLPGTGLESWRNDANVKSLMAEKAGVRINLNSNYMTYFKNGQAVAKWKVGTGRVGKGTPPGLYRVHAKDVCPPWKYKTKPVVPGCDPSNPLGTKALWFGAGYLYGMHGVNQASVWTVQLESARGRDVSSGCVRNHPENIEWLFKRAEVGTPVAIGFWNQDPQVVDCSGNAAMCDGGSAEPAAPVIVMPDPELFPLAPQKMPTWCGLKTPSNEDGLVRIYAEPDLESAVTDSLDASIKVHVSEKKNTAEVVNSEWFKVGYFTDKAKQGFVPFSAFDCSK